MLFHMPRRVTPSASLRRTAAAWLAVIGLGAGESQLDLQVAPAPSLLTHLRASSWGAAWAALPPDLAADLTQRADARLAAIGLPSAMECLSGLGGARLLLGEGPAGAPVALRLRLEAQLRDRVVHGLARRWQAVPAGPGRWTLADGLVLAALGDGCALHDARRPPPAVAVPAQDAQAQLDLAAIARCLGGNVDELRRRAGPLWGPLRAQALFSATGLTLGLRGEASSPPPRPLDAALLSAVPAEARAVLAAQVTGSAWVGAVDAWLRYLAGLDLDAWLQERGSELLLRTVLQDCDGSVVLWVQPGADGRLGWVLGLPRSRGLERLLAAVLEREAPLPEQQTLAVAPLLTDSGGQLRPLPPLQVLLQPGRVWLADAHLPLAELAAGRSGGWATGAGQATIAWAGPRAAGLGWCATRQFLSPLAQEWLRTAWPEDPALPAGALLAALGPALAQAGEDRWRLLRESGQWQWEGQGPVGGLPLALPVAAADARARWAAAAATLAAVRLARNRARSLDNIRRLAAAVRAHEQGSGEAPLDLAALLRHQITSVDAACLDSPWLPGAPVDGQADYAYVRPQREPLPTAALPLLMEDPARSGGQGTVLALSDGSVRWLPPGAAERVWQQFLRMQRAGVAATARDWQAVAADLR
jgi:hypothetical protein